MTTTTTTAPSSQAIKCLLLKTEVEEEGAEALVGEVEEEETATPTATQIGHHQLEHPVDTVEAPLIGTGAAHGRTSPRN